MEGFLMGYELPGGVNYHIYYLGTKEFNVSRDVIFTENEFFATHHVEGFSENILLHVENDAEEEVQSELGGEEPQNVENAAPVIYDEIVV